jgi:hypothetical protein
MIAVAKDISDITSLKATSMLKESFKSITEFIVSDDFYKDHQLSQVAKYFNAITSKMRSAKAKTKNSIIQNNVNASKGARNILTSKYAEQ